jgi:hypothetical protein
MKSSYCSAKALIYLSRVNIVLNEAHYEKNC